MDLTTRCPRCGTVFQAGLSDLQLRKGYIRCVQCAHIFDGYAEVVSDASGTQAPAPAEPAPEPGPPAASPPQVIRAGRPAAPPAEPAFRIGVAPWPDDQPEPRIGEVAGRTASRPVEDILADEGWVPDAGATLPAGPDEPAFGQAAPFVVEARPGHRSRGGSAAPLLRDEDAPGWWDALVRFCARLLFVLLLLLLAAQAVYVYRADIARLAPALRPALERACEPLHCRVPYARDIARIAITGSALKAADGEAAEHTAPAQGADGQRFVLHATLRNQAEQPQEWPTLTLDLKDAAGTLLVRRNLAPADYLGPARAAEPFPARSEILVRVPLTLSGIRINGYQLDLFYP